MRVSIRHTTALNTWASKSSHFMRICVPETSNRSEKWWLPHCYLLGSSRDSILRRLERRSRSELLVTGFCRGEHQLGFEWCDSKCRRRLQWANMWAVQTGTHRWIIALSIIQVSQKLLNSIDYTLSAGAQSFRRLMDGSQPDGGASVANQSTDTKAGIEGGHAYQRPLQQAHCSKEGGSRDCNNSV